MIQMQLPLSALKDSENCNFYTYNAVHINPDNGPISEKTKDFSPTVNT
jgi:hypothetical protein